MFVILLAYCLVTGQWWSAIAPAFFIVYLLLYPRIQKREASP